MPRTPTDKLNRTIRERYRCNDSKLNKSFWNETMIAVIYAVSLKNNDNAYAANDLILCVRVPFYSVLMYLFPTYSAPIISLLSPNNFYHTIS